MSAVQDGINAIRAALKLADDVKLTGESLKALAGEVRDHEKRIIRLEVKWETAMEFAKLNVTGRLSDKG
jgi:hypothetical protein